MASVAHRILVVDDEPDICRALQFILSSEGYRVDTAPSGGEALDLIRKTPYDLLITDLRMEGMDGLEVLERTKEVSPSTIVIVMTAYASVESAVSAMKKQAADYIVKPFVNEDVKLTVRRLLEHRRLELENKALREQIGQLAGKDFIGSSPAMQEIFATLGKVIPSKSNILLLGESGTGKGMIAEIVHFASPRSEKRFVSINCSAIPETLLESELLGYRKGAFTGADADKKGLIVAADGGTLFLDEIGDMPPALQAKLLRVLESGEVLPLGETRPLHVDVRIIAATNRDLREAVRHGEFREDLFYRLDVISLTVPPLRERKDDIPELVDFFLAKFGREHGKVIQGLSDDARKMVMEYAWPGNVRELRNVMERAVLLCSSEFISPEELPSRLTEREEGAGGTLREQLGYYERQLIVERLSQCAWNKEETARDLGVDLATLYRKMKKLGIEVGRSREG